MTAARVSHFKQTTHNIIYTVCWELKLQQSYGPFEYLQQKAWGKKYVTHRDSVVAQCGFNNRVR